MKINKQSLEEQATEFIRNMIVSGQLAMGEKIVESTLSKDLELSRSTVRMALNSLSHEGLVVQKPYVGWHVFTLSHIIAVCEKDFELHRKVVEISKSNKFIKIYEQISNQLKSYIKLTHHDYDLSQSGISHNGIVDAIIAGDANRAWLESKENITTFTDLNRNNTESN